MKQTLKIWIYEIDRKEVILDSYLAKLYNVETKRINETVKDNPEKFPRGFSWILPDEEKNNLWSKFSTANSCFPPKTARTYNLRGTCPGCFSPPRSPFWSRPHKARLHPRPR